MGILLDKLLENYSIGQEVLSKLIKMDSKELLPTLKSILGSGPWDALLDSTSKAKIERIYHDEWEDEGTESKILPQSIRIVIWDSLEITSYGIYYKTEHSSEFKKQITFNKHFKL